VASTVLDVAGVVLLAVAGFLVFGVPAALVVLGVACLLASRALVA